MKMLTRRTEANVKKLTEAVAQRCSVKKMFLEILQNSLEKTCARVFFLNKVAVRRRTGYLSLYLQKLEIKEHLSVAASDSCL